MNEGQLTLIALSGILVLGIGSQWVASRLKIPSILMLLLTGVLAGPATGFINPDKLFGSLLLPIVSLSIAVILFEGAMTLQISELKEIGRPLLSLLTVGVAITGIICALAAYFILGFDWNRASLIGAILTVTGPTVVGPLLHHIRPLGRVGPLARWEGIVIDPVGAILAVLMFAGLQAMKVANIEDAAMQGVVGFVETFLVGGVIGLLAAMLLCWLMKRHQINDHLQSPVALMLVILAFTSSNLLHHESGLVAVTVMGLIMANQRQVAVRHIMRFKENLTVLLISSLFVVLTARLDLAQFAAFSWRGPAFVAVVILVARPVSVMLSTIGCGLLMSERLFLAWMAPRGIVAAAVASVFALELGDANDFVAAVFLVIVGTVVVYGLTTGWVAQRLGLSIANPQGVLIASAHAGARAIAKSLKDEGISVQLVDSSAENIRTARMEGLRTFYGNILSEDLENIDLGGLGRFMALTRNEEANLLSAARVAELFGRSECYRLSIGPTGTSRRDPSHEVLEGRVLFSDEATYRELDRRFANGHVMKATRLSDEFTIDDFHHQYPDAVLMFGIDDQRVLTLVTTDAEFRPVAGHTVIGLVAVEPKSDNGD